MVENNHTNGSFYTNSVAGSLTAISKLFWMKFQDLTRCPFATMKTKIIVKLI